MANAINVPINLLILNLQSLIGDLLKLLSGLKVGSAGFNNILKIITSIRSEIDKLSVLSAKPFINASLFTRAENSVDKLEDKINEVTLSILKIKFSDLELTSGLKADLLAFEDSINSIKEKLKTVKLTVKEDFLKSDLGQKWLEIDSTAMTLSLDKITREVAKKTAELRAEFEKLLKTATDYLKALSESLRIKDFTNKMVDDPSNGVDLFSKKWLELTLKLSNNRIQFKTGGKTLMVLWLESLLKLDHGALDSLLKSGISANNIGQKLRELLNDQLNKDLSFISNNSGAEQAALNAKAKYEELDGILQRVGLSELLIALVSLALAGSLHNTEAAAKEYKDGLVQAQLKSMDVKDTTSAMQSQLDSLRGTLLSTNAQFILMQRTQLSFNQMKMAIVNFMGFNQVLNLTKRAVKEAMNHIKELDTVMNKISIVTDMSTSDLWGQIDLYSKMAQSYGVSIKGAYEVSLIYYQQGLDTADVLTLTNETLKLAKISGLDYALTTDYMTTALRGFKMEMSEASTVVDVYSNLAANTAVSQEELAVAMSKTASSMESVGSTFEETSAMIATMVAVTRESATNIGSAMKSIASRYGELTKDPTKLVDEDGEAMAFNKVDAALQSVGISMKTVDGQFREFTDVIVELSERWDELDSTLQRYIATQFAGNRQQSRFLALVSNKDILKANLDVAENSEDIGTLLALKALDSIESKMEQVKVAYLQFYTTIGAENAWKGLLDGATNVINTLNSLPKLFGKIPVGAIAAITSIVQVIKGLGLDILNSLATTIGSGLRDGLLLSSGAATEGANSLIGTVLSILKGKNSEFEQAGKSNAESYIKGQLSVISKVTPELLTGDKKVLYDLKLATILALTKYDTLHTTDGVAVGMAREALLAGLITQLLHDLLAGATDGAALRVANFVLKLKEELPVLLEVGNATELTSNKFKTFLSNHANLGLGLLSFGSALNMIAMTVNTTAAGGKTFSGVLLGVAGMATLAGVAVKALNNTLNGIPWMAIASGVMMLINSLSTLIVTPEERLEELTKKAEELSNTAKLAKADYNILDHSIKKLDELKEKRYESAEAAEEYQTAVDELAEKFPLMIAGFDESGNVILDVVDKEYVLAEARRKSAEATYKAAKAEMDAAKDSRDSARKDVKDYVRQNGSGLKFSTSEDSLILLSLVMRDISNGYYSVDTTLGNSAINNILLLVNAFGIQGANENYNFLDDLLDIIDQELSEEETVAAVQEYFDSLTDLTAELKKVRDAIFTNPLLLMLEYNTQFDELLNAINNDDYSNLDLLFTSLENILNQLTNAGVDVSSVSGALGNLINKYQDYIDLNKLFESYSSLVVSAWLNTHDNVGKAWNYISESSGAALLVTEQIVNEVKSKYKGNWEVAEKKGAGNWKKLYLDVVESWWNSLNKSNKELFNSMFADSDTFDASMIISKFNLEGTNIAEWITEHYSEAVGHIRERLSNQLKQKGYDIAYDEKTLLATYTGDIKFVSDYVAKLNESTTTAQENFLTNAFKLYDNLMSLGFTNAATDYGEKVLTVFDAISKIAENPDNLEVYGTLVNSLDKYNLNTKEGINNLINYVKSTETTADDGIIESLENLRETISTNISLTIQSLTSEVIDGWSDASKTLSKLTSGIDLTDVESIVRQSLEWKLDISFDSFKTNGDKLVLAGLDAELYWKTYFEKLQEKIKSASDDLKKAAQALLGEGNFDFSLLSKDKTIFTAGNKVEEEIIENFKTILGEDFEKYFNIDKDTADNVLRWRVKNINTLLPALQEAYDNNQSLIDNFNRIIEILSQLIEKSYEWSRGDYSSLDSIFAKTGKGHTLLKIIRDKSLLSQYISEPDVKNAFDKATSAMGTLLSDVLSKGFEDISLTDYEGLILGQVSLNDLKGSYELFVLKYANLANKSISEVNDLLAQAIEKDMSLESVEGLKDLQFIDRNTFTASISALATFANTYGLKLLDLLKLATKKLNGLYELNIYDIEGFNPDMAQFQETVQDSVNSYMSELGNLISKGISGSLSAVDVSNLIMQVNDTFGTLLSASDFTISTDGLKMANDAIFDLYASIKQISPMLASKMLPSMLKMSTNYDDLLSITEELTDATGNAKIALQDLAGLKRRGPEQFKFTENGESPEMWQWAEAFFEDIYKARGLITESSKSNTMDPTSFYRMMSTIAANNGNLTFGTARGEDRTANDWIKLVNELGAFTKDKSGNFVIDFKKLGFNNFNEFWDAYATAMENVQAKAMLLEETLNNLREGTENFDLSKILGDNGEIDVTKIPNEMITALNEIKVAAGDLPEINLGDLILKGPDTWSEYGFSLEDIKLLLKNFDATLWTGKELPEQLAALFGTTEGINVDVDSENGNMTVRYHLDGNKIIPVYMIGTHELTGDNAKDILSKWNEMKLLFKGAEVNEEAGTIDYVINGLRIFVKLDYNTGEFEYTITIKGLTFTTNSYDLMMNVVRSLALLESAQSRKETVDETTEMDFLGYKVKVRFDANGMIEVADYGHITQKQYELLQAWIEDYNKTITEELEKLKSEPVEVPVTEALTLKVSVITEGADIKLATGDLIKLSNPLTLVEANANELKVTPTETTLVSVPTPKNHIPELTGIVSKLVAILADKNPNMEEIDTAWETAKNTPYTEKEKLATIELLNIVLGRTDDKDVELSLANYKVLPIELKTAILSSILLVLKLGAVLGEAAKADFNSLAAALLIAGGVPVESVGVTIKAFNVTEDAVANSTLDDTSKATVTAAVNAALIAAEITGDVSLAKLIVVGFSGDSANNVDYQALIKEDGTLDIGALVGVVATATVEKLKIVAKNIEENKNDFSSEVTDEGLVFKISGATAELSGLHQVIVTNTGDLKAVDSEGNDVTVPMSGQIASIIAGNLFDLDGNYIGTDEKAYALVAKILSELDPESWQNLYNDFYNTHQLTALVKTLLVTEDETVRKVRAELAGRHEGVDLGLVRTAGTRNPQELNEEEILAYVKAMRDAADAGLILSDLDLLNLEDITLSDFAQNIKDIATSARSMSEDNSKAFEEKIAQLKKLSEIDATNVNALASGISTLASALSEFSSVLSLLQGVEITSLIEKINLLNTTKLDSTENSVLSTLSNLNLELNISDSVSGGFETLNSAITAMGGAAQIAATGISALAESIKSIPATTSHEVNLNVTLTEGAGATGNVSLTSESQIKAVSFAKGTLVGELGPELVVSNGHYFVVGQNGAEMVNLPKDAIVFNHILTLLLLANGRAGRGKPITNERNAAGMAHATGDNTLKIKGIQQLIDRLKKLLAADTASRQDAIRHSETDNVAKLGLKMQKTLAAIDKLTARVKELTEATEESTEESKKKTKEEKKKSTTKTTTKSNKLHDGYVRHSSITSSSSGSGSSSASGTGANSGTGTGAFGGMSVREMGKVISSSVGAKTGELTDKQKKAISSAISEVISKGFESIDLDSDAFKEVPANIKEEMKKFIADPNASYAKFLEKYKEYLDISVHEFNEQYFAALQKDLENEGTAESILSAAEGLTFFTGGAVAGSSTDWVTLFGDYTDVQKLVLDEILKWDANLKKYVITDIEALKKYGTNLDIDAFEAIREDSIRTSTNLMADWLVSGLEGSLSSVDFKQLLSYIKEIGASMIGDNGFSKTGSGIKITAAAAAKLYAELCKIDSVAANITLKKLDESLSKTNEDYKTTSSLLAHIKDLLDKIAKASKYDTTKINQYKEELALAQLIAAIRATSEDLSMNFLDLAIPGGFNNPLNYIQNLITGWKTLNEAATKGGAMDFKTLYNLAREINNEAATSGLSLNLLGLTLDGTATSLAQFAQTMATALGTDSDGNFGVVLSKLGIDLTKGASDYAGSADTALKTMAKSLIEILDGLIAFFEAIVAMEKFEKADIDKNGLLDLSEIFQLDKNKKVTKEFTSTFKKIALDILATAGKNSDLSLALKSIKFDGISLEDLLKDATNGKFNIKGISLDTYQKIMSLVYEAYKKGDYNLDNIADSVLSVISANESGYKGTIDLGTMIIDVESKTKITKTSSGKWQYTDEDGKTHETDDSEEALRRTVLGNLGAKKIKWSEKTKTATGELTIAGKEVKVKSSSEGTIYIWKGNTYKSLDELYKAMYDVSGSDLSFEDWKVSVGITVTTKMSTDTSGIDPSKVLPLVGKAWEDVLAEYEKNPEEFKIKYGFEPDKTKTASDWAEWLKTIGIEDKVYKLSMYIEKLDFSEDAWTTILKLISGEAYTKVVPNSGAGAGKPKKNGAKDIDSSEETPYVPTVKPQTGDTGSGGGSGGSGGSGSVDTKKLEAYKALLKEVLSIVTELSTAKIAVEADKKDVKDLNKLLKSVDEYTTKLANVLITVNTNGASGLQEIVELLEALNTKLDNIKDKANVSIAVSASEGGSSAKGNVALAAGRTLMGELGPELVVSNGRYFTVGNNGAEFVNLPKDAIVFNHLLTQLLLSNGHASRGVPAVSETAAVSMAAGNALASASETLATLKALRAMWQALADSSIQDLVKTASADSTSNGGGSQEQIGAWLKSVERWYNWLLKIAAIEKEINKEEAFRSKLESDRVKDGEAYFNSLARLLALLLDKANTLADLAREYAERFEFRKRELNSENSPMSQFYRYNDYGQLYYVPGGFEKLLAIMRQDDQGHTITPKELYDLMLKTYGLGEYMKYDSEGKELTVKDGDYDTYYRNAVLAAWDRMEAERDEMQSLYDASNDMQLKYLESILSANKILQAIADNLMSVENSILEAIEALRQAEIDNLTDERKALSDSVSSYINGLTDSLNKERKMYENLDNEAELNKLRRLLSILQRSGGSASLIANLLNQISEKDRQAYFNALQDSIDAVKDASDLELEKLLNQIDLMTETLAYEKENGLLWGQVADIMRGDSQFIADFVTGNDKTWVAKSPLAKSEALLDALFEAEQWTEYRDSTNAIFSGMTLAMSNGFSSVVSPLAETKEVLNKVEETIRTTGLSIIDKLYILSPRVESSDSDTPSTYTPPSNTPETPLMPGKEKTNYKGAASLEVRFTIKGKEMVGLITTDTYEASTKKDLNKTIREEIRKHIKEIAETEGYDDGSLRYLKDGKEVKYTSWNDDIKDAIQYLYFSRGGEVNYTGPAIVHGSPDNPEYMLNADEYRMWKNLIVGSSSDSLTSRLLSLRGLLDSMETLEQKMLTANKTIDTGTSIEHAEVNMYVQEIANDYDAQRAGQQALEEMLRIAAKSKGNRLGR